MGVTVDPKLDLGPLDLEAIKTILPHREPFLLLDEIVECVPGVRAVGIKRLTGDEDFFRGHFPGNPVMPGVLQLEALAQTGGVAVLSVPEMRGKLALFGGASNVRFPKMVRPGDEMVMEIDITYLSSIAGKGKGRTLVNGMVCSEAGLMFVISKAE